MRIKYTKKIRETTRDRHLSWIDHYVNNEFGIWIECTVCKKWRVNHDYSESHEVPENWCCSMGTTGNGKKGNCEDPEEEYTEEEYFEYCPGSLVWARLDGYPWWPGMVDEDPDVEEYFFVEKGTHFYNVTFLDERVTHAWIPATCMNSFLKPPHRNSERLKTFSFAYLYKGKWPFADDFEDNNEGDNPHDITDILLQEVDELGSVNSSDAGDQECNEMDFLSSEKKMIKHDLDFLKENNNLKSSNANKHSFITGDILYKINKMSKTRISNSAENINFVKSFIDIESANSVNKKKSHSSFEKETMKKSKNSKLSIKKLKTENDCMKSNVYKPEITNLNETVYEKENRLVENPKKKGCVKSTFSVTVEETTIEKECINIDEVFHELNTESNKSNPKVDKFLNHLDECITDVINAASMEIELTPLSVKTPKKKITQTEFPSLAVKTPEEKIKEKERNNCKIWQNVNEIEVWSKDCGQISSEMQETSKNMTKVISSSKDNKQNISKKKKHVTLLNNHAKMVGNDKLQSSKSPTNKNSIDSLKDSKIKTKIHESKLNGNLAKKKKCSSMEHSTPCEGNKIKPDFKTFKRPFKNITNFPLMDNAINKKQCTEETRRKASKAEKNSQQLLEISNSTPLGDEKSNAVLDEPYTKSVIKKIDYENILEDEAITDAVSKDSADLASDDKENYFDSIVIDDDEKENVDKNIILTDQKDTGDCFFYASVSDEE